MPTWKESLAIDVPAIDRQHKELLARADARADSLLMAMREGRAAPECKRLLAFLREYCQSHFGSEESLMTKVRSPGRSLHVQQHQEFTRRFEKIAADLAQTDASSPVVIEIQGLIGGWLVNHIGQQDVALASFLGDRRSDVSF